MSAAARPPEGGEGGLGIPEGFRVIERPRQTFMSLVGPTYIKQTSPEATPILGLRAEEKHLNMRGIVHGGMLVSFADSALASALNHARQVPLSLVTVSLTTDFVDAARLGDWIEAHVDVQKVGVRMAFANCYLQVGTKRILRASGVFAVVRSAVEPPPRLDG